MILLFDASGTLVSSLRDRTGAPLRPSLPPEAARRMLAGPDPYFHSLILPNYRGYMLGTEPVVAGQTQVDSHMMGGAIDAGNADLPVGIAFTIPRMFTTRADPVIP